MRLLDQGIATKKIHPCPICSNVHGCKLKDDIVACLRGDSVPAPVGYKRIKPLQYGMGWLYRKDDLVSRTQTNLWKIQHISGASTKSIKSLTSEQRDEGYREVSNNLSSLHRDILLERGLSEQFIKSSLFFSWGNNSLKYPELPGMINGKAINVPGIFIPAYTPSGRVIGGQILPDDRSEAKYKWVSSGTSSYLYNSEQPLFYWKGEGDNVWLCEGALKPAIASHLSSQSFIGAVGNFFGTNSTANIVRTIGKKIVILAPDAGAVRNGIKEIDGVERFTGGNVARGNRDVIRNLERLGYEVKVAWWNQFTKDSLDIDELYLAGKQSEIEFISPTEFFKLYHPILKDILSI